MPTPSIKRYFGHWVAHVIERIIPAPVDTLLIAYLGANLSGGVTASTRRSSAARQITVTQVGGSDLSVIHERPMVTFQAWSTVSQADARDLAHEALSWLKIMDEPRCWYGHKIGDVIDYPDGVTGTHRYQFTLSFIAKGMPQ